MKFVRAHRRSATELRFGRVAKLAPHPLQRARARSRDAGEVRDARQRSVHERAEEGRGDLGPFGPEQGVESPVERRDELGPYALIARDRDRFMEILQCTGIVPEA